MEHVSTVSWHPPCRSSRNLYIRNKRPFSGRRVSHFGRLMPRNLLNCLALVLRSIDFLLLYNSSVPLALWESLPPASLSVVQMPTSRRYCSQEGETRILEAAYLHWLRASTCPPSNLIPSTLLLLYRIPTTESRPIHRSLRRRTMTTHRKIPRVVWQVDRLR
jgi:hypothetical protein